MDCSTKLKNQKIQFRHETIRDMRTMKVDVVKKDKFRLPLEHLSFWIHAKKRRRNYLHAKGSTLHIYMHSKEGFVSVLQIDTNP